MSRADKRNLLINPSCYQHLFMSHLVKQLPWKKVERNPWITSQRQICQICWICTPHRLMYSQNCCVCVSANGICAAISFTVCRKTTLDIGNLERNVLTSPCYEFDVQQFAHFRYSSGNEKQAELPSKASFWPQVWLPANGKPWKTP